MHSLPLVRPMTVSDIPAARHLWSEADGVELAEGDSPDELRRYLERNPGCSQVALLDGRMVGALLAGHDGRRGLLYHLAVANDCRGRGIGRDLVARAVAALAAAGVPRVLLLVVRDNAAGRAFWRRLGWEEIDSAEAMGRTL